MNGARWHMGGSPRIYQACCLLAALAVLLAVAWPAHDRLMAHRARLLPDQSFAETQELDSFALGLLLGGFRGPLVMYLWVNSEEQKHNEQTERFLTQARLIGDLQPQFATIYVHQSWNLAYNVSVQYNRENEKYLWVMEGVDFIERGIRRLPNNVEVLSQAGHIYLDKLGESYENRYYRARFRQESLDRMLDSQGRLLPAQAERWKFIDRLEGMLAIIRENRRSDIQTLAPTTAPAAAQWQALGLDEQAGRHRWPHGLSVFAIAYDYYKQAFATGQSHPMFSDTVLSSRPAIACRAWLRETIELAMLAESRLWPIDQLGQPLPAVTDGASLDAAAVEQALFYYRQAQQVAELARAEYETHTRRYPREQEIFVSHLNDVALRNGLADAGERRLAGIIELLAARGEGNEAAVATARRRLQDARSAYLSTARDIRDYMVTEYRREPWGDDHAYARAPYELLADQAQRAADQIDQLLRN